MNLKKNQKKTLWGITSIMAIIIAFASINGKALAVEKTISSGSTWVVETTTAMNCLKIMDGAVIKAPEGYSVTLTVDGIGTPIEEGLFKGKVVLTVTKVIEMAAAEDAGGLLPQDRDLPRNPKKEDHGPGPNPNEMPEGARGGMPEGGENPRAQKTIFKTNVYIEDGNYIAEKSVEAGLIQGDVTDEAARDIKIISNEGNFNGIIVTGDEKSSYKITDPVIKLNGNGGNDTSGLGMGILVGGKAEVTVENANIINNGSNRSAVFVRGEGVIHVNNSYIETNNLENEEILSEASIESGIMTVGPWLLGIKGDVRATNVIESGTAYYNNTHIKAQGWGALSTDGPVKVRLYATECLIETVESGYGVYSIGDCLTYFSNCVFNVNDYGAIVCDFASATFTDKTTVNSKRIGIMMHDGSGGGLVTIDKGSVFNTKSSVFQIKGRRGANIVVDDAQLNSENGIILQTMPNDDPNMSDWNHSGGNQTYDRNVNAAFSNLTLKGDIINGFTASGSVNATFKNAKITGAITTAIVDHKLGPNGEELSKQTPELYYLIGEVTNTYRSMPDPNGIFVSLDSESEWVVDKTSYLNGLTIAIADNITAPKGYKVTLKVDGIEKDITPGAYKGKIVLDVTKK